jgi:hypothetical protein
MAAAQKELSWVTSVHVNPNHLTQMFKRAMECVKQQEPHNGMIIYFSICSFSDEIAFRFKNDAECCHFIDFMSGHDISMKRGYSKNEVIPESTKTMNGKSKCELLLKVLLYDDSIGTIIDSLCDYIGINRLVMIDIEHLTTMSVTDAIEYSVKAQSYGFSLLIFQLIENYFKKMCGGDNSVSPQQLCDLMAVTIRCLRNNFAT